MTTRSLKRIQMEIKKLDEEKEELIASGIYYYIDPSDITIVYVLFIGKDETPYENGFYFFKFEYPSDYPMIPPKATYFTQGLIDNQNNSKTYNVRFNPNLYIDGKVCLSMLNTWAGPGWVPTNTILNVLVAIQALVLGPDPLKNEPGFENSNQQVLDKYSDIISFANIKIAVLENVIHSLNHSLIHPFTNISYFEEVIENYFYDHIDWYRQFVREKQQKHNNEIINSPCYVMNPTINYEIFFDQIEKYYGMIQEKRSNKV